MKKKILFIFAIAVSLLASISIDYNKANPLNEEPKVTVSEAYAGADFCNGRGICWLDGIWLMKGKKSGDILEPDTQQ
ncbi:MAG TPA: hypothetical protein PLC17_09460 [Tenuifilaceae bacterium]|jgi:hypothetical protein|nr:hypothetical protein [Tenuifilaceae bacterium]HQB77628.1 hypothetical protein [Tenuifilaceae bacterium]